MNFIDQRRTLDPRDSGRWPLACARVGGGGGGGGGGRADYLSAPIFLVCSPFAWYMFSGRHRPGLQKSEATRWTAHPFENKQLARPPRCVKAHSAR